MAHLTGTLHTQRAQVGDTFTKDDEQFTAIPMDNYAANPCKGCAFCGMDEIPRCDYETPDCVSFNVIFIRAPKAKE